MSNKLVEYSSVSVINNPRKLASDIIAGFFRGRELGWYLAVRDISAKYRQHLLGYAWLFLPAVVTIITFLILNSVNLINSNTDSKTSYPVFIVVGTMIWRVFVESITTPIATVNNSIPIITKVNIPYESLFLSSFYVTIFKSGILLIILIPVLLYYRILTNWSVLFSIIPIMTLMFFGLSLGFLLSPFALIFKDISNVIPIVLNFLMLLTPVAYRSPKSGLLSVVNRYNPIAITLTMARDWILSDTYQLDIRFIVLLLMILFILSCGLVLMRLSVPILVERI